MKPIEQESIAEQVRLTLRREIELGHLEPGSRIFEDALAQKLGTSKMPIRLALHQLKQDGLVRIEPRKGTYVAIPSPDEIPHLLDIREVLEGLAARSAATHADKNEIAALKACFGAFSEADLDDRSIEYASADHRFHTLLVAASGNKELIKSLDLITIRLHMYRLRRALAHQQNLVPIHRDHLRIIDAIESRDGVLAEHLVRAHVRSIPWRTVVDADETAA
jgi:DNA-binding GntR family transcriptional regulator